MSQDPSQTPPAEPEKPAPPEPPEKPAPPEPPEKPAAEPAPPPPPAASPAPEAPPPFSPAGPPPPPPGLAADPPKRKRRTGLIAIGVASGVLLLLCLVGIVVVVALVGGDEVPVTGDCLTDATDANDMEIVDCDSSEAAWSVIGTDGTMTRGEFSQLTQDDPVCAAFPETEQALWVTESGIGADDGTDGEVICLQQAGAVPGG